MLAKYFIQMCRFLKSIPVFAAFLNKITLYKNMYNYKKSPCLYGYLCSLISDRPLVFVYFNLYMYYFSGCIYFMQLSFVTDVAHLVYCLNGIILNDS